MIEHLRHRGPDDRGLAQLPADGVAGVVLGHARLAIIDLSPAGHQPMAGDDGSTWITFNGEIYNYRELRRQLDEPGRPWRSATDTEVILRAYKRWGRDCLGRLRGMFAFAIWDGRRRELFLARDRLGIKPLYTCAGDGFLAFASEVRALLATGLVRRQLDPIGLWQYLAYQSVPPPRTLVEGVRALPPGHWTVVGTDGRTESGRYWDLLANASAEAAQAGPEASRRRVGELLREAVRLHLVSDVPIGAFLSGGIDSSALVGLMREVGAVPRTFTVTFDQAPFDEAEHARRIAARFGTDHTEIRLTEPELRDGLGAALAAMDQPSADGINTHLVSGAVRAAGVTVALSGLGGDELFAGYASFRRLERARPALRLWGRAPRPARALVGSAVRRAGRSSVAAVKAGAILAGDGSLAAGYPPLREVLSAGQRRALLERRWLDAAADRADPYEALLRPAFDDAPRAGPLTRTSYAEARTYLHDVLLKDTDQMSMAHSLEARVPLLDHELVEYVMGLPDHLKRPNGTPKRLLVESLPGLLPEAVVHRPKQGFVLPLDAWMRGPLRPWCEAQLGRGGLGGRGIFRPDGLESLWESFLRRNPAVTWSRPWLLIALEVWLGRTDVR